MFNLSDLFSNIIFDIFPTTKIKLRAAENKLAKTHDDLMKLRAATDTLLMRAMHRRAQRAEGELAKIAIELKNEANNHQNLNLIIENSSLRELVRWFLLTHDYHSSKCDAWGCTDLDVCRNNSPMHEKTCDYPHCNCGATMKRDSGRKILDIK